MDSAQEDLRMLHGEILQTLNQRFLTTTAAVTLFGVVTSVAVSQAASDNLVLLLSALLLVGLFMLYIQLHFLRRATLTLASYILVRGWSEYATDFAAYRATLRKGPLHTAYNNAHTGVFLALSLVGVFSHSWSRTRVDNLSSASWPTCLL